LHGIAGHILAVLRKLDTKSVIWALVKSGDESFDHEPGPKLETLETNGNFRIQKTLGLLSGVL